MPDVEKPLPRPPAFVFPCHKRQMVTILAVTPSIRNFPCSISN